MSAASHGALGIAAYPPPPAAAFLPLTLSTITQDPGRDRSHDTGRYTGHDTGHDRGRLSTNRRLRPSALTERAWATERSAQASWQALLGGCAYAGRRGFPDELRGLSEAVGHYLGDSWWHGPGRTHRDRVTGFERWVAEALTEGDGAGFAEACAGYDAALARALVAARGPSRVEARGRGQARVPRRAR